MKNQSYHDVACFLLEKELVNWKGLAYTMLTQRYVQEDYMYSSDYVKLDYMLDFYMMSVV